MTASRAERGFRVLTLASSVAAMIFCACDAPPPTSVCPDASLAGSGTAEDTIAACSDCLDNDANGFTDCSDFSCSRATDPEVRAVCPDG